MSKAESQLWSEFLLLQGTSFLAVAYDVPCGTPGHVAKHEHPNTKYMWQKLTSKRIDALVLKQNRFELYEVKINPDIKSPGQPAAYKSLLLDKIKTTLPVFTFLLTRHLSPDTVQLCRAFNVTPIAI